MIAKPTDPFESKARPSRAAAPYVTWRLLLLGVVMFAVFGALAMRLYYLTILRGPYFYELSENNYLFEKPVAAARGKIFASDGTPLSLNRTLYEIQMSPYRMEPDQIAETVERVAELLNRPEIAEKTEAVIAQRPKWKSIALARGLEPSAVTPVVERLYQLPGVAVEPRYSRDHPLGPLVGHVTGYIRQIDKATLDRYPDRGYLRADLIGKAGVERQYEEELRGEHGTAILIRDARGRPRSSYVETPATRGNDIVLTIDLDLQRKADELLSDHDGVAIAMDPRNGAILALVSKLDYDPNHPLRGSAGGVTSMYDKVTRGRYAPGSTFKLVTAAAGLASGKLPSNEGNCPGYFKLPNVRARFNCDLEYGHDTLDLYGAIQKSCNVYFYRWANEIGRDRMLETARAFGFGRPTGIDLPPEGRGILATAGVDTIYKGSVVQMGIGQGALIAVSPIQLINAYAALANGGTLYRPHLLKEVHAPGGKTLRVQEPEVMGRLPLDEDQLAILVDAFSRVIQRRGGTGNRVGFKPEWNAAGKTGSAEVAGQKLTNGWFVAFAPADAPRIVILALVEAEGHGGATAGPIVRDLMEAYFEKNPNPEPPADGPRLAEAGAAEAMANEVAVPSSPAEEVPQWARRE